MGDWSCRGCGVWNDGNERDCEHCGRPRAVASPVRPVPEDRFPEPTPEEWDACREAGLAAIAEIKALVQRASLKGAA